MALVSFEHVLANQYPEKFVLYVDDVKQEKGAVKIYWNNEVKIYYINKYQNEILVYEKGTGLNVITIGEILNIPSRVVRNYGEDSIFDALYNHGEEDKFVFKNGKFRSTWFNNLVYRFQNHPRSFETRRRAEVLCDFLNNNPNPVSIDEIPFSNGISKYIKFEYFENKYVYIKAQRYFEIGEQYGYNDRFTEQVTAINENLETVIASTFAYNFYTFSNYNSRFTFLVDRSKYANLTTDHFSYIEGVATPNWIANYLIDNNYYCKCKKCKKIASSDYFVETDICYDCCGYNLNLRNYSTKATDFFDFKTHSKNKTKIPRYFGIELEYEFVNSRQKAMYYAMKHLHKHVISKRDGSVEEGVEFTSCPADIEIHKEVYKPFFENLHDHFKASSKTGMHVHVDKGRRIIDPTTDKVTYTKMSFLTLGKINYFMRKSANADFIHFVAERVSRQYASVDGRDEVTHVYHLDKRHYLSEFNRYASVNFQGKETIEFRIFATPENYFTFCKNLEFCDALVTFCSSSNFGLQELTVDKFIKFVDNNRKEYSSLSKFLKTYDSKSINFVPEDEEEEDYDEDYDDESEDSEGF